MQIFHSPFFILHSCALLRASQAAILTLDGLSVVLRGLVGRRRVVFSSSGGLNRHSRDPIGPGRSFASSLTAAGEGLFTVLFPSNCRICQAPLTVISALPVCKQCLRSLHRIAGPVCAACGERLTSVYLSERDGAPLCGMCLRVEPVFTRAAAYGSYESGLRELIHLLKYQHVRPAASVLGRMLAEVITDIAEVFAEQAPDVVPVPLHAAKLRQRGFNQSELIARAALKLAPGGLELKLNTALLMRQKDTESQTGLTPHQRRENMRGAFHVLRSAEIVGRDVLLVDDVFTTGTTASECARVLRRAGAQRVFVVTVARVLKPEAERAEPEEDLGKPVSLAAHA